MYKLTLTILVAALVSSGCTMIPKYEPPASPVGAQYPGVTQTNVSNAADLGWESVFTDERLKQLIRLSLTNNADYQVAVLNVEQSRAQYRITRSASFPVGVRRRQLCARGQFHHHVGSVEREPQLNGVRGGFVRPGAQPEPAGVGNLLRHRRGAAQRQNFLGSGSCHGIFRLASGRGTNRPRAGNLEIREGFLRAEQSHL